MRYMRNQKGISLIGMVLSIVIIAIVCYFFIKVYFKEPSLDEETKQEMAEQGINSSNKLSMIEGTRNRVKGFNKSVEEREKQFEQIEEKDK